MKARASFAVLAALALLTIARFDVRSVRADTFGSGANTFSIDFVTIGNPGNGVYSIANPAGSVPYDYRIGKYEIPEDAIDKANAASGLAGQPLNITKDTRGPDKPATSVTWFEAAQFVNWLNTSTGHTPAYKFINGNFALWQPGDVGYDGRNRFRNGLSLCAAESQRVVQGSVLRPGRGPLLGLPDGQQRHSGWGRLRRRSELRCSL